MKTPAKRVQKTDKTNDRRLINSASIIIHPEWEENMDKPNGYVFGATQGGVNFNAEVTYRVREYDGTTGFATVGDQVVESAEVTATVQLAELTVASVQKIMKADVEELSDGRYKLKPRRNIKASDYLKSVGIVGWLPNNDWILITMQNVLVTSPLVLSTEDNGDMTMEVTLTAHIDPSDIENIDGVDDLPYDVVLAKSMKPEENELPIAFEGTTEGGDE